MKRRQAIQNIALITSGIVLMPACNFESRIVYENVPLEPEQYDLIQKLTEIILPNGELEIITPETRSHFVLTMINDCYDPEDIEKYLAGLQAFQQPYTGENSTAFQDLEKEEQIRILDELVLSASTSKNLLYFLDTTKQMSIRHFTSSEYFLKNHLAFEFVPARFSGCVPVGG